MNCKRAFLTISFAAAAVLPLPAFSQAQAYFGASLGGSDAKDFCELRSNCDKSGTAWRFFGGVQLTRNLGAEIGYVDFGKFRGIDPTGTTTAQVESGASDLNAVFTYPLNRLSLFGKVGGYYAKSKATFETATSTSYGRESNGGLTYGLGAQYDFMPNFAVRGDWQRYAKVGGSDTGGEHDVDVWLVGLVWKMR